MTTAHDNNKMHYYQNIITDFSGFKFFFILLPPDSQYFDISSFRVNAINSKMYVRDTMRNNEDSRIVMRSVFAFIISIVNGWYLVPTCQVKVTIK